jgi:lysophospholipase L1-like esterase
MEMLKFWSPDGFEVSSYKWKLQERVNKRFNGSGSDTSDKCTYTYNELGFRGDSIHKEGFKIMSIGCSITEGIGVNDTHTWPNLFSKLVDNGVDLNFGFSGRSNDYISRCLLSYYDIIKPDLVLIMYTFTPRKEYYTQYGGIEPFVPGLEWGYMKETEDGQNVQSHLTKVQNNNEDFINWYKNHLLIKYFLESKKCNWIWNGSNLHDISVFENNRYDGGYSIYTDLGSDGVHPGTNHNSSYAIRLYNFIYKNFRNYLPENSKLFEKSFL